METNKEALRAKENAEKRFAQKDFIGAKDYALKAQTLCPELEGISQMVATFQVYIASEVKVNGETDLYSILGLEPSVGKAKLKKQYRRMAVLLHPDKNKTVGADGAFRLVSEAWSLLSDCHKRTSYDLRRNRQIPSGIVQTNPASVHTGGVAGFDNCSKSSVSHGLDTFWTVCTSCQVQYEYLRKYLNKRLSCKNCRGVFIAVETGKAPINGSFPYCPWSYVIDNGYGSHGYNGVSYLPTTAVYFTGNGASGHHSGHGSEYVSNVSFQWSSYPGASAGLEDPSRLNPKSANIIHQADANSNGAKFSGKHHIENTSHGDPSVSKPGRTYKKRKVEMVNASRNCDEELASKASSEFKMIDENGHTKSGSSRLPSPNEVPIKRCSAAPTFDLRKLLMDKARTEIRKKLEELKATSEAADGNKKEKANDEIGKSGEKSNRADLPIPVRRPELKKTTSLPITVPDSDFHDFDKDRSEECFKPKQIWAIYDEEDGMPRLYCLIREVLSVNPFKIHISYLNSKTNSEFGSVNWVDCGFTKSCGSFRAWNSEIVEQVNIFSHLLSKEKTGRGGCVRIYPRSGDVWAVYRNWSPHWNRTTPDEVRHQYEMVEVLGDYSEEVGVFVNPLVKLDGFKTVYQSNKNKDAIRWIPRREMLRFSHQVPSLPLKGEGLNMPDGCWDLDPAAIPDELLLNAS
ncbi:uncharacterized protein LOC127792547 [Diospyros lotus]|uniref:uncharacterized protein LOC127792547 n=1 Tax=Diospyros lotus TaxID=55363 RepID=UPI002254185C|nr:uncharacterized protein LOC127792547 [Diospyros lotus]